MANDTKQILEELKVIKSELDIIKERMPDKDMFLTSEEKVLLEQSFENEKAGKLISSKDLRKKLIY